jgi:hypothetical protein
VIREPAAKELAQALVRILAPDTNSPLLVDTVASLICLHVENDELRARGDLLARLLKPEQVL